MADYNRVIELNPLDVTTYLWRGQLWHMQGAHDLALADFNRAVEYDPKSVPALLSRGHAWRALGDVDRAMADYSEAIRIDGTQAEAYFYRGALRFTRGSPAEALADLTESARLKPHDPYTLLWLYLAQARAGQLERARTELATLTNALPGEAWPATVLNLYLGRLDQSALAEAIEHDDTIDRTRRRCEADFYLAEYRLLQQQILEATDLLSQVGKRCSAGLIEAQAAKAELARLVP